MQSLSKNDLTDLLRFVEQQIVFTIESTRNVSHCNNFLTSMEATILFNSTCMCLQTIGGTIRVTNVFTDSAPAQERVRMPGRNFM